MEWSGTGLVCAVSMHGESGAVARLLTPDAGMLAGYVRGGASRTQRPILQTGNRVSARWHARLEDQLGHFSLELETSRAGVVLGGALPALALEWITGLLVAALPERDPHGGIYAALDALLARMNDDVEPIGWLADMIRLELSLLADLGYGLDLSSCAATGALDDLAYVSPKSSQAVSRAAGLAYHDRLLPLPAFLLEANIRPDAHAILDGLRLTTHFLHSHIPAHREVGLADVRQRLRAALERALAV
jgi:DNA repair protein RecO (recombination protein O)